MSLQSQEQISSNQKVTTHKFLVHNKGDHVGVATSDIEAGERVIGYCLEDDSVIEVEAKEMIPLGHKISLVHLEVNEPVLKYGIQIGYTTKVWNTGDYVHTHNIKSARW